MKSYQKIFLIMLLIGFFAALYADELSEQISELHQNISQLRIKLKALQTGLNGISKHLRGEEPEQEEVHTQFAQNINKLRSMLAQDISEDDVQAGQDVHTFRLQFLASEQEPRFNNIDASTVLDVSAYVENVSNNFVTKLYTKYGKVAEPDSFMRNYTPFKEWIERDERHNNYKATDYTQYNKVKAMTWALLEFVKAGLKPDMEVLADVLPQFEKDDRELAVAFLLLSNQYSERDFLAKTVEIIIKDSSSDAVLQDLLNGVMHYTLSQVIYNADISKDILQNIHAVCKKYESAQKAQKKAQTEILAALYARYFLDEIQKFKKQAIHLENQRKQKERQREAEERRLSEEKERRKRQEAEQKQREADEKKKRELEEKIKIAQEAERKQLEVEKKKLEEDRQRREEEERQVELQRQQEEEDYRLDRSFEELKRGAEESQIAVKKKKSTGSLLEAIKKIAAISVNQDIIEVSYQQVNQFNFIEYLNDLLEHVNARALRSEKNLKEILGYTDKILRNILASKITLEGMVERLSHKNDIKPIAKIIALLFLVPDGFIATPENEPRLTAATVKPISSTVYAANPKESEDTNILHGYIRFIAKIDSLETVNGFLDTKTDIEHTDPKTDKLIKTRKEIRHAVSIGAKSTLMKKLKEELNRK